MLVVQKTDLGRLENPFRRVKLDSALANCSGAPVVVAKQDAFAVPDLIGKDHGRRDVAQGSPREVGVITQHWTRAGDLQSEWAKRSRVPRQPAVYTKEGDSSSRHRLAIKHCERCGRAQVMVPNITLQVLPNGNVAHQASSDQNALFPRLDRFSGAKGKDAIALGYG